MPAVASVASAAAFAPEHGGLYAIARGKAGRTQRSSGKRMKDLTFDMPGVGFGW